MLRRPISTECIRTPTPGERALAHSVFGVDLDPDRLTFRRAKWWIFQPAHIVMAPDGHIWFHPDSPSWRDDFSHAHLGLRGLVVHELVHVWQFQHGVNLVLRRLPLARYDYRLVAGKAFARYGIEQQAEIVRDAYVLREGGRVPGAPPLAAYADVIPFGRWERPLLV